MPFGGHALSVDAVSFAAMHPARGVRANQRNGATHRRSGRSTESADSSACSRRDGTRRTLRFRPRLCARRRGVGPSDAIGVPRNRSRWAGAQHGPSGAVGVATANDSWTGGRARRRTGATARTQLKPLGWPDRRPTPDPSRCNYPACGRSGTRRTCPGWILSIAANASGTSGRRSSRALLTATRTTTPSFRCFRFCWYSRFRSPVTNTKKPACSASASNAPFLRPAQACCWTVRTSWPGKYRASCLGSCSSSRTCTGAHRFVGRFEGGNSLFPRYRGERIQELVEAVVPLQVVDEISKRHPRPDEDGRPPKNLRVTVNDKGRG